MVLSGCETAVRVGINANDRGGGRVSAVVTLDRDAQKVAGGDLTSQLRVVDLAKAGWKVEGPSKVGKDIRVTATKKFASPAGVARAVRELDNASGLFHGFRVTQHRSFVRTTTRVRGTVDLRKGIESFSDDELTDVLGSPLGATPAEFAARIGHDLSAALPVTVGVILPGEVESNATSESGGSVAWHPELGERIAIEATAKKWNTLPIGFAAVAVLAAGTAVFVGLGGRRRSRRS
ncbi:MAG TPA: hypothetical protein VMZ22_00565 [Acidimicrobiales bacterium]|nr:hypothetical protein [Acidimicrobiales bacterium]